MQGNHGPSGLPPMHWGGPSIGAFIYQPEHHLPGHVPVRHIGNGAIYLRHSTEGV